MLIFKEIMAHKYRALKTLTLYLMFFTVALFISSIGPTLLDLEIVLDVDFEKVTWILPSKLVGSLIGILSFTTLNKSFDCQLILITSLFISSFTFALIPLFSNMIIFCSIVFIHGIFSGLIESGGFVWVNHLWGKSSQPFMLGISVAFGIGSLVAPLIARPFLLEINEDTANNKNKNDSKVQFAYLTITLIGISVFIIAIIVYCFKKDNKEHPTCSNVNDRQKFNYKITKQKNILINFILALYFILLFGFQMTIGNLLLTYTVNSPLNLSKSSGSLMTSCFWFASTLSRVMSIFLGDYVSSKNLNIFNISILLFGDVPLFLYENNEYGLWITVILYAFGSSTIYAVTIGYLHTFTKVTKNMMVMFVIWMYLGENLLPFIISHFIIDYSKIFIWFSLYSSIFILILFIMLIMIEQHFIFMKNDHKSNQINVIKI